MSRRFLGWVLLWTGVLIATLSLSGRVRREQHPSPIEIAVEWRDLTRCASAWRVSNESLLRGLRREGVRGVVCEFATLASLSDDGEVTLLGRAAAEPVFPVVHQAPPACSFVLATSDARLFAQVNEWLKVHQGVTPFLLPDQTQSGDSPPLKLMAMALAPSAITQWPLGFVPSQIEALRAARVEPLAHFGNPDDVSPALIEAMMRTSHQAAARLWLPDETVPGFRTLLPVAARSMRRQQLALGFMEGDDAEGIGDIAEGAGGWLVRGHEAGPSDTARLQRDELLDRYVRAARERNARLLVVRLLHQLHGNGVGASARQQNLQFIADLKREIVADPLPWRGLRPRLQVGLAQPVGVYATSARKAAAARFGAGLGVWGAFLLLLALTFEVRPGWRLGLLGVVLVAPLAWSPETGAKLLALGAALVFPVVALAWSGLDEAIALPRRRHALRVALWVFARVTGLSLAGGIIIAALLNDWTFHAKVADFAGTKAASVVPVLVVALLLGGDFWPRRIERSGAGAGWQRLRGQVQTWSTRPFTLRPIFISLLSAVVVGVWLARSGNDSGFAVSSLEWKFRALLEAEFIARPRTKEFLLCHPALIVGVLAWLSRRRRLGFALLLLGLIGQINVVNSFAQANNPLYIPFWRTLLAWILGAGAGSTWVWWLAPKWGFAPDLAPWRGWRPVKRLALAGAVCALGLVLWTTWHHRRLYAELTALTPQATWPWPHAQHEVLALGVEHWFDNSAPDGTTLDLLAFDFKANLRLRFSLFDSALAATPPGQKPSDRFAYWNGGLGTTARGLNRRGDLVAAWNGGFWGLLNQKPRSADRAFHLAPVVVDGRVHYPGLNRRWTWGAKIVAGRPHFALDHTPKTAILARDFDFATGTLQALLKDGHPLEASTYPWFGAAFPVGEQSSARDEAGTVAVLDQMHTSRIGVGWTPDDRLFVLVVKEPDGEAPSRAAVHAWKRGRGGWTLRDHQNFWLALQRSLNVQNAVGLDGGDVAQALYRRPDGKFDLLVPRLTIPPFKAATLRLTDNKNFDSTRVKNLHGSALNYFVIRENTLTK